MMTLKDLYKYLFYMMDVKIYLDPEDDPEYEGSVFNIPYRLIKMELNIDEQGEALYVSDNKLIIYLKESEND